MNLPDRVFALGGAGKAIVYEMLSSDWILEEVLQPRQNPDSLKVTVIDTAEGEKDKDNDTIRELRQKIAETESDLRDPDAGRTGSIDLEYKLITDEIQLNSSLDLIGDEAVDRITSGNGMNRSDWWIEDNHINENLDFAEGVVRKRGLGKAIYYKAYAEDDNISTYIDLPGKGKVAIIAGVGGGTGSGILIDLARQLNQRQSTAEITLFGVLPNHTEGIKESANAYAALSELEALSLEDEQVFKDQILVPIGPTGYDGKKGHHVRTARMLKELDEAFIYLLTAYYSTDLEGLEDPFENAPKYAPFTIGIPQILRFKIESINESRERLRNLLDIKEESLQAEKETYNKIARFLETHYPGDTDTGLRDTDESDIRDRVTDIKRLLELDLFNELEYQTLPIFKGHLQDAENETDDVSEQVEIMSGAVSAVDPTENVSGSFVDNIDMQLAEILGEDIQTLGRRKNLFQKKSIINDSKINAVIEYLLGSDDGAPFGVRLQKIETQLQEYQERYDRLQSELDETERELQEVKEEHEQTVARQVNDWERATRDNFNQLKTIDEIQLESSLETLKNELNRFQTEVVSADSLEEVEDVSRTAVVDATETVADQLQRIDIEFDDQHAIERSLDQLKNARKAFLKHNQEESTLGKITPWQSATEQERQEALKQYRRVSNKLGNNGVFTVNTPTGNFGAELEYSTESTLNTVDNRARTLKEQVLDELRQRLDDPQQDIIRELGTSLEQSPTLENTREIAKRAYRQELSGVEEIEQRRQEIQQQLADVEDDIEVYEATVKLLQDLKGRRDRFVDNLREFRSDRSEYEEGTDQPVAHGRDSYVYVKQTKPEDVFRATGDVDIAESELLKSSNEEQRVRGHLEELVSNTLDQQYHGLKHRKFERPRERYDELKIRTAVISRALGQMSPGTLDFESQYTDAFNLGASGTRIENRFTSWTHQSGDRWDIGLATFVQGVFLDNLRKMVQPNGYRSGYESRENQLGDDIFIHHSYDLDDGRYVRRRALLNVEDSDDIDFYLRSEPEITEDLRDQYVERKEVKPSENLPPEENE